MAWFALFLMTAMETTSISYYYVIVILLIDWFMKPPLPSVPGTANRIKTAGAAFAVLVYVTCLNTEDPEWMRTGMRVFYCACAVFVSAGIAHDIQFHWNRDPSEDFVVYKKQI